MVRSRKKKGHGSTKGDRSRAVDFGPRPERVLRELLMHHSAAMAGDAGQLAMFVGRQGERLSRSDISRDLHKDALRDAGLRTSLRLHDLRHTAAVSWLAVGLPMIYVQRQLGHASSYSANTVSRASPSPKETQGPRARSSPEDRPTPAQHQSVRHRI